MITHLVAPETFDGDRVIIEGDAYRHLFRARRLAQGAPLRIVDGAGRARSGTIDHIERKRATVELGDPLPSHEAGRNLRLVVAPLRPERASWLVEKATELGAARIQPMVTRRCVADKLNMDRARTIATEAAERAATELAVNTSPEPRGRPQDFDAIVAVAIVQRQAAQVTASLDYQTPNTSAAIEAALENDAEPEPAPAPSLSIPSSASVARQARLKTRSD